MPQSKPHPTISSITASSASIVRTTSDVALPPGPEVPLQDAVSVIIQLRPLESLSVWCGGNISFSGGLREGSLAIVDLRDTWRCQHDSAFDDLRIQIDHRVLKEMARNLGIRGFVSLTNPAGAVDPVLLNLARALLPSLDHPEHCKLSFLDQVVGACLTHILQTYGDGVASGVRRTRLTPRQEALAKEILASNLLGSISIDEVAAQCSLSRGHFIRAFCESTGKTPHQWLIKLRIDAAKTCLTGATPISKIAKSCGFADQSHLTRVFKRIIGVTPAEWRRANDK